MKDYQKPVAEEVTFATEAIAAPEQGTVYGQPGDEFED